MIKRQYIISAATAIASLILASCTDLTDITNRVKDLESRMTKVEGLVKSANESITAQQKLIDALKSNKAIKDYRKLEDGSGYVLVMSDGEEIIVRSGKVPQISVIEQDGVLYWAIDGKIMHDAKGDPIPARGDKGDPGAPGQPGDPGQDGITPQVRISTDGFWEVSIDNGTTWKPILDANGNKVKAQGEPGEPGQPGEPGTPGQDGQDGITPTIRVSADGYWEVSIDKGTTWKPILDANGNKVKAQGDKGEPGQSGAPGTPGQDGQDGEDGITPQLRVDKDGYWEVSLDKGITWQPVLDVDGQKVKAKATDANLEITEDETSVTITYNGKTFVLPKAPKSVPATGISISLPQAELSVGETLDLFYKLEPANASAGVEWKSDDEAVATVSANGLVTAVKAGTAHITVSVIGQPEIQATCTITVMGATEVSVTKLTLTPTTAELKEGDTLALSYTIEPANATNKELVWSSSVEAVATVDATGKVTAVKAGTTTITVASKANPEIKATCEVTVVPAEKPSIDDVPVVGL